MTLLSKIWTFLVTEFAYVFTNVAGVFTTILSEIPDDEVAILHKAMKAAGDALLAGKSAEEAFTVGLDTLALQEVGEGSKLLRELLQAFVTATAPKS